jgi:xylulokinase
MDASMPAAKMRWIRDAEPDRWRATRAFLGCKDFLRHRLTGDLVTDPIDACATSLFDITSGTWSEALLAAVGTEESRLPVVAKPEEIAGPLRAEAASELGLRAGIPVAVGAGDDVEVLGNGLLDAGACLEHVGTTGSILAVSQEWTPDPALALEVYPHVIPGLWVLGGSLTTAGAAIAWAADVLGYGGVPAALEVLRHPRAVGRGVPTFVPHLAGERVPNRVPWAQGAWIGLEPGMARSDLMLAAFEGVAFGLRAVLERVDALAGRASWITVSEARDADVDWLRLRASVYERPLATLSTAEPTALGLMAVLATAVGAFESVEAATRAVAGVSAEIAPDPGQSEDLRGRYGRFLEVSDALRPLWGAGPAS